MSHIIPPQRYLCPLWTRINQGNGVQPVKFRRKCRRKDDIYHFFLAAAVPKPGIGKFQRTSAPANYHSRKGPKIQAILTKHDIAILRALNVFDGVRVSPQAVNDTRFVTKNLDTIETKFTTNQLAEDRDLVLVIRGITDSISAGAIKSELTEKLRPLRRVHQTRKNDKI